MAVSVLVSVRGQVMEYMYIPTGIKGEMVRSGVDCHWKGQVVGTIYIYRPRGKESSEVRIKKKREFCIYMF